MNLFSIIPLYFDPSLGAMVIQSLIAAVAAFLLLNQKITGNVTYIKGIKRRK